MEAAIRAALIGEDGQLIRDEAQKASHCWSRPSCQPALEAWSSLACWRP